jgi:type I restriction enzyme R subunit
VVLARVVNSMTEFKQIIGRGTRLRADYGKLFFNIVDYTGSATRQFADPNFDGFPEVEHEITVDEAGNVVDDVDAAKIAGTDLELANGNSEQERVLEGSDTNGASEPRKYYVDGGQVKIAAHLVYELDEQGRQLRVVQYTDYTAEKVRTLFRSADELKDQWADPLKREEVLLALAERGIIFQTLAEAAGKPDADPFDLLCHLAFHTPIRTRKERAERLRQEQDFFKQYGPRARDILYALLDKYADFGPQQFVIPDILLLSPFSGYGNVTEIAGFFGGAAKLREAVNDLQTRLYA